MGGALVRGKALRPLPQAASLLADYADVYLVQARSAFDYWQSAALDARAMLPANLYEDMFGSLLDDSERHFEHLVPEGTATCNPMETLLLMVFLTSTESSMQAKLKLAAEMTIYSTPGVKEDDVLASFKVSDVQKMVLLVLSSFSRVFPQVTLPPTDEINSYVAVSLSAQFLRCSGTPLKSDITQD